jgi:hypothetical protein
VQDDTFQGAAAVKPRAGATVDEPANKRSGAAAADLIRAPSELLILTQPGSLSGFQEGSCAAGSGTRRLGAVYEGLGALRCAGNSGRPLLAATLSESEAALLQGTLKPRVLQAGSPWLCRGQGANGGQQEPAARLESGPVLPRRPRAAHHSVAVWTADVQQMVLCHTRRLL